MENLTVISNKETKREGIYMYKLQSKSAALEAGGFGREGRSLTIYGFMTTNSIELGAELEYKLHTEDGTITGIDLINDGHKAICSISYEDFAIEETGEVIQLKYFNIEDIVAV